MDSRTVGKPFRTLWRLTAEVLFRERDEIDMGVISLLVQIALGFEQAVANLP